MRFLLATAVMLAVLACSQKTAFSQYVDCGTAPYPPSPPHKPEFTSCTDAGSGDRNARCQARLQKTQDRYREKMDEYQADTAIFQDKSAAFAKCIAANDATKKQNAEARQREFEQKKAEDTARKNELERQIGPAVQAVVDKFSARGQVQLQANYSAFWLVATKSDDMLGDLQTICKILARHDYVAKYRQYSPSGPKVRAVINVGSILGPRQEISCE
ncbi:MAG: hypothetical protein HQL44_15200 [Alphaproteobacteria bacterium]|nr:hypothetical protein [Alphaproteobacteria bacterium]